MIVSVAVRLNESVFLAIGKSTAKSCRCHSLRLDLIINDVSRALGLLFRLVADQLLLRGHCAKEHLRRLFGWHRPIHDLEVHDCLELTQHSVATYHLQVVNQELVVPGRCRCHLPCRAIGLLLPLNGSEIFQVDVDVGEVFTLILLLFEHLKDKRQSFLPQDLN